MEQKYTVIFTSQEGHKEKQLKTQPLKVSSTRARGKGKRVRVMGQDGV